jgi:hypothetical protein
MATNDKDFKVKNGLQVGGDGIFEGAVTADALQLDTSLDLTPAVGKFSWNPDKETANLGLDENVTLQIGQDHVLRVKNANNDTAIPSFTFVMFAGAAGDTVTVVPAITDGTYPPEYMVGITTEEIPAEGFGFVTQFGFIDGVNTSAFDVGDLLYPSPTTPGGFTTTLPAAPAFDVAVAAVTFKNASAGRILVRMSNGLKIEGIHNVQITDPENGEVLTYEDGIWKNLALASQGGVVVSDTAPEDPENGNFWLDTTNNRLKVYIFGTWTILSYFTDPVRDHTHDTSINGNGMVIANFVDANGPGAESFFVVADGGLPESTDWEFSYNGGIIS